ncbi:hypothetical protein BJ912DRAFT_1002259 [Pholiota molesta]|nr:hypothetical protein BJ912DRAFT_1002259 [Pholiota molesta]
MQAVETLVELSRDYLDMIAWALSELLDRLAKTQAPSEHSSSAWQEPPALDDSCVKYILSVMVLFMRQTATAEVPLMLQTRSTDIAFRDYDETDAAASAAEPPPPPPPPAEDATLLRARGSATSVRSSRKTHVSFIRSATAINNLIAKYVGGLCSISRRGV